MIVIALVYFIGCLLSLRMLQIEHEAEGHPFTHGDRFMSLAFASGSLLTVIIILVLTWIKRIGQTGYWARPIKADKPVKKEDAK